MMLLQFIVLQVVVFGVVIYFLKKIFHGDTNSAIQRLGSVHEDLLQKQIELQKKNEEIEKEVQAKREEANLLVEKLRAEAAVEIRKKEDEVLKVARSQAEEIIAKAQSSREDMVKEVESQVSKKTIHFSAEVVKKALNEKLIALLHAELVIDFVRKAKDMDLSSAGGAEAVFVVRSPIVLKKEENDKISALLASKLNRVVQFSEVLDTDLIAGVVMQFGSLVLDGSLTNLLKDSVEKVQEKY